MKLKYYLRGLGIGIIVTAIIMSFIKKPEELTDAEIKARAAMLGMVEKNVLADVQENSNLSKETVKEENKIETVPEIEDTETDLVKENMGELDSAEELSNTEKADEVTENLAVEKKEEVIVIGSRALRFACCGMLFMPFSVPVNMLYQSIQKPTISSFLSMVRAGAITIPLLLIGVPLFGLNAIQLAQPTADVIAGLVSIPFVVHFLRSKPTDE